MCEFNPHAEHFSDIKILNSNLYTSPLVVKWCNMLPHDAFNPGSIEPGSGRNKVASDDHCNHGPISLDPILSGT